jgi:hypothetical protein
LEQTRRTRAVTRPCRATFTCNGHPAPGEHMAREGVGWYYSGARAL